MARVRTQQVETPDGRVLIVDDLGDRRGPVVVAHHGTPRCRLDLPADPAWIDEAGIRLVSFDRAGYGRSTNLAGRAVIDSADDVRTIADALSVESFAVIGVSWGGPHALATAAGLGARVTRVCVCSGLAPAEIRGFDPEAGLPDATREELEAARLGPATLRRFVERHVGPAAGPNPWLEHLAASDLEVLARPGTASRERAIDREWRRVSFEGWVEDSLACHARPWGFQLAQVTQPTLVMHGDADRLVPPAHAEALARALVDGRRVSIPSAGHVMVDHGPIALRWLTDGAGGGHLGHG